MVQVTNGLTYDDVLLVPKYSTIPSRSEEYINLSSKLADWVIRFPIISANMDTITGIEMSKKMHELGGLGIIHRFMESERHRALLAELKAGGYHPVIGCIGVGEKECERYEIIRNLIDITLIDVAHGHCKAMLDQIEYVRDRDPTKWIIAGNVATYDGAKDLINAGVDVIKIGVGNGSVCETRRQTGNGVPQLTAIFSASEAIQETSRPVSLIADGGINSSGDCVKAFAAGASFVMIGGLFAGTEETLGKVYQDRGLTYKVYRGLASREAQLSWKGYTKSVEGELIRVPYRGSVGPIFNELIQGILSGMSYQDATTLWELRENTHFVTQTTAGQKESETRGGW